MKSFCFSQLSVALVVVVAYIRVYELRNEATMPLEYRELIDFLENVE